VFERHYIAETTGENVFDSPRDSYFLSLLPLKVEVKYKGNTIKR